jgi:hypothetical protein
MQQSMDKNQIKDIFKMALVEALEERPDLLHEAIETALEDIAFCRAIEEGEKTQPVSKTDVLKILEGKT